MARFTISNYPVQVNRVLRSRDRYVIKSSRFRAKLASNEAVRPVSVECRAIRATSTRVPEPWQGRTGRAQLLSLRRPMDGPDRAGARDRFSDRYRTGPRLVERTCGRLAHRGHQGN